MTELIAALILSALDVLAACLAAWVGDYPTAAFLGGLAASVWVLLGAIFVRAIRP